MTERGDGQSGRARAARAVGLEVSRARYVRTLDRVRRCERATRLAARLGPLDEVVADRARCSVEVASADARLVLGKLWMAGERYRRMLEAVDRDPDRVDPGADRSPGAVGELRRRLSGVPDRFEAGEYRAVAETLAAARTTIRALFAAREDDCEAFAGVDPDRLEAAAEAVAEALRTEHRDRREARRAQREESRSETDYRTPVGNSDQIHPEALDPENVDPDLIASLADEDDESHGRDEGPERNEERVATDDQRRTSAPDDGADPERDGPTPEEAIGAGFELQADETETDSREEGDDATEDGRDGDGAGDEEDDTGGFRFGVVDGDEGSDRD
ncbi:MAG: hypothetical protein V5A31_03950 [Haloferacaceae archaeon]